VAESTLTPTYLLLQAVLRDFLGEATKNVDSAITSGYRMALGASRGREAKGRHKWSWLSPDLSLVIWPSVAVEAGVTVTGVYSGVTLKTTLTLTYGTSATRFYPSMVGHSITITSVAGTFTVTDYTSATVILVKGDATCAGKTFSMAATGRYTLPDDYGSAAGDFYYAPGVTTGTIRMVTEGEMKRLHEAYVYTADPTKFAIIVRPSSDAHNPALATRWDAWFWPTPGTLRTLTHKYNMLVNTLDGTISLTALGGPDFGNLVQLACLSWAEMTWRGGPSKFTELYYAELDRMVGDDAGKNVPRNLGYCGDSSDQAAAASESVRQYPVTFTQRP
jgi:hypothetical protein